MSTKIYTGFRFDGPMTRLHPHLTRFAPWVQKQGEALMDHFEDSYKANNPDGGHYDWHYAWKEFNTSSQRCRFADTRFQVVVFPVSEEMTIGMVFHDQPEWFKKFMADLPITEFNYWDNADGDESVPPDEWEARGKLWDKVCPDLPSQHGYTIDLHRSNGPVERGQYRDAIHKRRG